MNVSDEDITKSVVALSTIYDKLKDREFYLGLTGDALSYTAMKIATLKALLVDVKKAAEIEAENAETEYKRIKAETLRRLVGEPMYHSSDGGQGPKISATAAADLLYGEEEVVEAGKRKAETKAQFNWLKSIVSDGHDVIESIRGRLIDLQGSRKDERV